ncbi:MAG: hypothetical protein LBS83_00645 [Holosporales bacterium]|jgi:hypothetical protein|nr:hypothetical protein [Holosporales bacterium]
MDFNEIKKIIKTAILIRCRQLKRLYAQYFDKKQIGNFQLISKKNIKAILIVILGLFCVCISSSYKAKNIKKTQKMSEQLKILKVIYSKHLDFQQKDSNTSGGLKQLLEQIKNPRTLKSLVATLEKKCNLIDVKTNIQKKFKITDFQLLSCLKIRIKMKSENDKNILEFAKNFEKKIPGIVVFENIEIKRIGKILTREDFKKTSEKFKEKDKKFLKFKASIQCDIIIPTKQIDNFT